MAQIYGERWEVISSLGEGGQSTAFLVRDRTDSSTDWVLKRLKNPKRLGRFAQEVEALRTLNCARVPSIVDHSLAEPAFLVYRYVGPTLTEALADNLTFDEAYDLYRDVVEAVACAHARGIFHRDIKPDNVLVDPVRGPGRRAHLIDFGICQWDEGGLFATTTDEPLGSRSFAPPEFELGRTVEPSAKSDVYSLGKLLYWMMSGGRFIAREDLSDATLAHISEPRGVERAHIRRLLQATVVESADERADARVLLSRVEQAGSLMRAGVNAVGAREQLCPACRIGQLARRADLTNLGFNAVGNPPEDVRLLHCKHCGYLQLHSIGGTESQRDRLWEV